MTRDKRNAVYVFHSEVWSLPESRRLVELVGGRTDILIEYVRRNKSQTRPQWLGFVVAEHQPEMYDRNLRKTDWEKAAYGGKTDRDGDFVFHLNTLTKVQEHIHLIEGVRLRFLEAFAKDSIKAMESCTRQRGEE